MRTGGHVVVGKKEPADFDTRVGLGNSGGSSYTGSMSTSSPEETGGSTELLERTEEQRAPGDEERYAHYVRKERITESAVEGQPVVALCGKVWTPTRNPDKFPVCPTCKEIYNQMKNGGQGWPFDSGVPGSGK